jgi:sulfate adenylyltransferase subunit 1
MICWLGNDNFMPRTKFIIKHTTNEQTALIKDIVYKIDVNSLDRTEDNKDLEMNEIARVSIKTAKPIMIDEYRDNRNTGSFILINPNTNETVAAGMVI